MRQPPPARASLGQTALRRMTGSFAFSLRRSGLALLMALAAFGFDPCDASAADRIRIGGTGSALGTMRLLAEEFGKRNPGVELTIEPSLGSGGGVRAVLDGAIEFAVTSRPLSDRERKLGAVAVEYARTPFVFAVSRASTVTSITAGELAAIYAGTLTIWPDGTPIRIVLRPESDIDTDIIKSISPEVHRGTLAATTRAGTRFAVTDQDAAADIERIPGAIGPTTLAVIVSELRPLRALELDGIQPSTINAASGQYPYFKRLYMVTGARPGTAVERFKTFVQSAEAQATLKKNGSWIP